MATNQTGANSEGVSKKFYNKIRHNSHCPLTSKPMSASPSSLPLSSDQKKLATHEVISVEIPIVFNTPKETTKTNTSFRKNGQMAKFASRTEALNTEPVPTRVAVLEKAKPKVGMAQPERVVVGSGLALKMEPKAGADQGQSSQSNGDEGKNSGLENVDDKFSNYIHRAKAKLRTTSNVGGGGGGDGKSGLRLDSFNDKVSSYINRAKIKIRTMSNVGGGRNVSIK